MINCLILMIMVFIFPLSKIENQNLGPIPEQLLTEPREERKSMMMKSLADKRLATANAVRSPARKQLRLSDKSHRDRIKLADRAVARCIYSNGLAFQLAKNTSFRNMCQVIDSGSHCGFVFSVNF